MTTIEALKVGDAVIDPETGEVLEWPEGVTGDQLEWLVQRAREDAEAEKSWKQAGALHRRAIGRLLDQAGVKSLTTPYGRAGWRGGRTTVITHPEKLSELAPEYELTLDQVGMILTLATALNPEGLRELGRRDRVPMALVDELIEERHGDAYVQVDPPRPDPPDIERVEREAAE